MPTTLNNPSAGGVIAEAIRSGTVTAGELGGGGFGGGGGGFSGLRIAGTAATAGTIGLAARGIAGLPGLKFGNSSVPAGAKKIQDKGIPFAGGQGSSILYDVYWEGKNGDYYSPVDGKHLAGNVVTGVLQLRGGILGIEYYNPVHTKFGVYDYTEYSARMISSGGSKVEYWGNSWDLANGDYLKITGVTRRDGNVDLDGDLPTDIPEIISIPSNPPIPLYTIDASGIFNPNAQNDKRILNQPSTGTLTHPRTGTGTIVQAPSTPGIRVSAPTTTGTATGITTGTATGTATGTGVISGPSNLKIPDTFPVPVPLPLAPGTTAPPDTGILIIPGIGAIVKPETKGQITPPPTPPEIERKVITELDKHGQPQTKTILGVDDPLCTDPCSEDNGKSKKQKDIENTPLIVEYLIGKCEYEPKLDKWVYKEDIEKIEFPNQSYKSSANSFKDGINQTNKVIKEQCEQKNNPCVIAYPDHHNARPGQDIPELVIVFREKDNTGAFTSSTWSWHIPHPRPGALGQVTSIKVNGGKYLAHIILKDGSKIYANGTNEGSASSNLRLICQFLDTTVLPKGGVSDDNIRISKKAIREKTMFAKKVYYYPTGSADLSNRKERNL